jgi:hypothetical protein
MEIGEIHCGNETENLLGLCLTLSSKAMEVNLWVGWNRVVNHHVKLLKRNTTSCDISQYKRRNLPLLELLSSFAQFNLRHVADQLERCESALL